MIHSNPQAQYPVPNDPLHGRAYYEVNPVPYDVTVERAHAGQDRIRRDGLFYAIPPERQRERDYLEDEKKEGEVAMETYYRVTAEQWEKEKEALDEDWDKTHAMHTAREMMRRDPANYEEVTPGKFRLTPGGKDYGNYLGERDEFWWEHGYERGQEPEDTQENLYRPATNKRAAPSKSLWDDDNYTTDLISLAAILSGFAGMYLFQPSNLVKNMYVLSTAIWRYLSFYRFHDGKAGVAAGVYWGSAFYLYGPKGMPLTFLFDLGAGRLWLNNKIRKQRMDGFDARFQRDVYQKVNDLYDSIS